MDGCDAISGVTTLFVEMAAIPKQLNIPKQIAMVLHGVPRSFCGMELSHPAFMWDAQSIFADTECVVGMAIAPGSTASTKIAAIKMATNLCARRAFIHMAR